MSEDEATDLWYADPSVQDEVSATTPEAADEAPITVEDLVGSLETVSAERDEYLSLAQRIQAEFDNFRRRSSAEAVERSAAGAGRLVEALLPVLDACDTAASQGDESAGAIRGQLHAVLEREGLERVAAEGEAFDPTVHEAVLHEAGDGEPTVAEELRPGYLFKGRVLRAAMVKVQG
ncbi:MAG: nucleotide exchange factor GrpE [Actinomycetia bacterium]|nr:nucleotide exchange factor GrpE [Actinomycetes bacterium]MCP4963355.1 nucleotide exchange factor GrpE [Actinomycetes bacterium]